MDREQIFIWIHEDFLLVDVDNGFVLDMEELL